MNRIEQVKTKYPSLDLKTALEMDPSSTHKYLMWIADQLNIGHRPEDIGPTIKLFIDSKSRLKDSEQDIYSFKDLKDLENKLKDLGSSNRSIKKMTEDGQSEYLGIYPNNNYILYHVYRIDSKEAAIIYGANTRWCITMANANYFNDYSARNSLFYFLIREKPINNEEDKICIQVERNFNNRITCWLSTDITFPGSQFSNILEKIIVPNSSNRDSFLYKLSAGLLSDKELLDFFEPILQKIVKEVRAELKQKK